MDTSRPFDETQVKYNAGPRGATRTTMTASVVEEVGDEHAEVAKLSEYDGDYALLSQGVGKVGDELIVLDSG